MKPSEVVGVPALPPGSVTGLATRARSALRGLADSMAPPPVRILEGLFGALDHRVLVAICEIELPDALDRPASVADLAARTSADADLLERLLRFASLRGWVRFDRRGRVRPTRVTRFLRRDHPGGWRAWVEFAGGDEVTGAIALLSAESGTASPFEAAHGSPFFDWMAEHPERWAVFDAAMAAGGRMHALALHGALGWSSTRAVCDIGGGTGHLLAALLDLLPSVTGTVVDLPAVAARAIEHPRLVAVAGDMFADVPTGSDTYLLVNVVHDWGDEEVVRLLGVVAAACGSGRIVVVDSDRPVRPFDPIATATDVLMAALTGGGRERSAAEVAALANRAGLRLVRSTRLASGDLAHELARA